MGYTTDDMKCFMPHCLNPGRSKDFNGLPIVFREDGYINMTKAARDFGKDLKEFFKNKGTKEYIKAMEVMGGIPPITLKQAKKGYHANPDVGTYGHPKLAVFFARWLDVRFAVWCDLMIDNILQGNIQTSVAVLKIHFRIQFTSE